MDCVNTPLGIPTGNYPTDLSLATEKSMQPALHVQATFLHIFPYHATFCHAETTFASELEAVSRKLWYQ